MNNHGLTLLEVLIAMAIFTMGMAGLIALQISSIRGNTASSRAMKAGMIAQLHMEKVIAADFFADGLRDINPSNNSGLHAVTNPDYYNRDVDGQAFVDKHYDLVINVADSIPIRNTKTIVVMVLWDKSRQLRKLYTVKSLSTESGSPVVF